MSNTETLAATISGARSIRAVGWHREEVEQAAVERLVRSPCATTAIAYRQGRLAAIDELRRLTAWRSHGNGVRFGPLLDVHDVPQSDVCGIDDDDAVERFAAQFDERRAHIILRVAQGAELRTIAAELGIDPSRVTQLLRGVRERGRPAA